MMPELLPSTEHLLYDAEAILGGLAKKSTAVIGGAVAMAFRGVVRATVDLDIFARDECRQDVLAAFRKCGYRIGSDGEPFLYEARPPWSKNEKVKVDLLFPADDPDLFAVDTAGKIKSLLLPVMIPMGLAVTRLYSDQLKHKADFVAMIQAGIVQRKDLLDFFKKVDPDMLPKLRVWLKESKPRKNPMGFGLRWRRKP